MTTPTTLPPPWAIVPTVPTASMVSAGFGRDSSDNSKYWLHPASAYGLMLSAAPKATPALWVVVPSSGWPALVHGDKVPPTLADARRVPLYALTPDDEMTVRRACFKDDGPPSPQGGVRPAAPCHKMPEVVAHVEHVGDPFIRFIGDAPPDGTALVRHAEAQQLAHIADYWREKYLSLAERVQGIAESGTDPDDVVLEALGTLCGADTTHQTANVRFAHGLPATFRRLGTKVRLALVIEDQPSSPKAAE